MPHRCWTEQELRDELVRFQADLERAGLSPHTITTYVDRSERFVRWLAGDYRPQNAHTV